MLERTDAITNEVLEPITLIIQGGLNDRDTCGLFTQKSVPVIFEPPCRIFLSSFEYIALQVICKGLYCQQLKTSANRDAATRTDIWMKRVSTEDGREKFQTKEKTRTPAERGKCLMFGMEQIAPIPRAP